MRILFFFVHPSKYHLFKHSINILKKEGHQIDVTIVTKDILEDLIKFEGWEYENILPEGRRSKKLPPLFSTIYFSLKTLFRLYMYCRSKKYDLFVSDDLLVLLGRLKSTPSIFFTDDDLRVVKEIYPLFLFASKIVAPYCTDVGKFNYKKIGYTGYHELAYLNPKYFTPDFEKTKQFNPDGGKYFKLDLYPLPPLMITVKKALPIKKSENLLNYWSNTEKFL